MAAGNGKMTPNAFRAGIKADSQLSLLQGPSVRQAGRECCGASAASFGFRRGNRGHDWFFRDSPHQNRNAPALSRGIAACERRSIFSCMEFHQLGQSTLSHIYVKDRMISSLIKDSACWKTPATDSTWMCHTSCGPNLPGRVRDKRVAVHEWAGRKCPCGQVLLGYGGFTGRLTPEGALPRATNPRHPDLCPLLRPYQLCLNRARVRDEFCHRTSAFADTFGHGTARWLAPSPQSSSPDGMHRALANAERLIAHFHVPEQVAYASDGDPPQPLAASCLK